MRRISLVTELRFTGDPGGLLPSLVRICFAQPDLKKLVQRHFITHRNASDSASLGRDELLQVIRESQVYVKTEIYAQQSHLSQDPHGLGAFFQG
ncbi:MULTISPECIES: hypothetical protein [Pseudomonas syringae group genomosp. 2]|uniref:hypothetical protein n=1 Tax=Pseudomonas syringae group genomosp. 2 TaxID=251698 RepID=UPI0011108D1D|nr:MULTISPECIES: hypothetical protein [Pseudomonas syringae group genomosp. 2]MCQ3006057.1 hypothetical protein [Pseudomonas savastanoi]